MKIFYGRGQREEAVAAISTLKKILSRFVAHRVFYELSARGKASHQLYSVKNTFTVSQIDVEGDIELIVTIFDANHLGHSIEIVNPHAMRVYDEPGKSFAVAFYGEDKSDFDVRYYLRDEGEDADAPKRSALERISLPQLFEYLQDITQADIVEVGSKKP